MNSDCFPNQLVAVVLLVGLLTSMGCTKTRPKTIPIQGKVTLNGGDWPGGGVISFRPLKAAEGYILRPGNALFDRQGTFDVNTYENGDGLVPGEYEVLIIYEEPAENQNLPPKLLIQGHDRLVVPADADDPIEYNFDVRQ